MLLGVAGTGGPRGDGAGETQERAFPIHHIPPTDCPYETDTFFFYNQVGRPSRGPGNRASVSRRADIRGRRNRGLHHRVGQVPGTTISFYPNLFHGGWVSLRRFFFFEYPRYCYPSYLYSRHSRLTFSFPSPTRSTRPTGRGPKARGFKCCSKTSQPAPTRTRTARLR